MTKTKLGHGPPLVASLFAGAVAAAAVALAAPAGAIDDLTCNPSGGAVICERDGHSSVTPMPPSAPGQPATGFGPRGGGGGVYGPHLPPHYPFR